MGGWGQIAPATYHRKAGRGNLPPDRNLMHLGADGRKRLGDGCPRRDHLTPATHVLEDMPSLDNHSCTIGSPNRPGLRLNGRPTWRPWRSSTRSAPPATSLWST